MDTNFKIGDRIVYRGSASYYDTDKVQIITNINNDGMIQTTFINDNLINNLHINSDYFNFCDILYGEEIFE
jgi:hypothetical protein